MRKGVTATTYQKVCVGKQLLGLFQRPRMSEMEEIVNPVRIDAHGSLLRCIGLLGRGGTGQRFVSGGRCGSSRRSPVVKLLVVFLFLVLVMVVEVDLGQQVVVLAFVEDPIEDLFQALLADEALPRLARHGDGRPPTHETEA